MNYRNNFNFYLSIIFVGSMLSVFTLIGLIKFIFHA